MFCMADVDIILTLAGFIRITARCVWWLLILFLSGLQYHSNGWGGKLIPHFPKTHISQFYIEWSWILQQMESRRSLSTGADSERNGSDVQEDWTRSSRVSSDQMVVGGGRRCRQLKSDVSRLLSLAGPAHCGRREEPVLVLHSWGLP